MNVIVDSDRDRRTLEWLIAQVGEDAVTAACEQLAGSRRTYVSNIAKVLDLSPPESLKQTPRDAAKGKLQVIKEILQRDPH